MRLRFIALGTFWLVALSVAWVGGSPWTWFGGGIAATCGHAFSWYRRHHSPGAWSVVMALVVMGLAVITRREILAGMDGEWLPMAHFLLLMHAISSFDMRTRGGLYGGLGLSGIVLFFASQQAFGLSFSVFLVGYSALLMAFLATGLVHDETVQAHGTVGSDGPSLVRFWSAAAAAVLVLAVAAFLLLPRGERTSVGSQEVSVLPFTGLPEEGTEQRSAPGTAQNQPAQTSVDPSGTSTIVGAGDQATDGTVASDRQSDGVSASSLEQKTVLRADQVASGFGTISFADDVVMHVRSPVASYWRGQVFDDFDGETWTPERSVTLGISGRRFFRRNAVRYTQTFFTPEDGPREFFVGYQGLDIVQPVDISSSLFGRGFSYKVVSAQPDLHPNRLRADSPGFVGGNYHELPASMGWVQGLAGEITEGSGSSFDDALAIIEYLQQQGSYDSSASDQQKSSASLEELLLEGKAGTSVDFATATALLARGAGLPSRLATGYLPGEIDLLSGAYRVRRGDAHAWAEIFFRDHGWVPFDGTPRLDLPVPGRPSRVGDIGGLKYLFESSVGDDLVRAGVLAPARAYSGFRDAFASPAIAGLVAAVIGALIMFLGWIGIRFLRSRRRRAVEVWPYSKLAGDGRDDMVRLYRRAEKLLRKEGVQARHPGQTLGEYAHLASHHLGKADEHLRWFTEATRYAAYDPAPFPAQALLEARARLMSLKAALG